MSAAPMISGTSWITGLVLAAGMIGLAGCGSLRTPAPAEETPVVVAAPPAPPPPPLEPPTAPRIVRESCVPRSFPRAPRYPDTDQALRAAGGAADRYQLLAAGRLARARRLAELERQLDACR